MSTTRPLLALGAAITLGFGALVYSGALDPQPSGAPLLSQRLSADAAEGAAEGATAGAAQANDAEAHARPDARPDARAVIEIDWVDLVPEDERAEPTSLALGERLIALGRDDLVESDGAVIVGAPSGGVLPGIVPHGGAAPIAVKAGGGSGVVTTYEDKLVRLPGFAVPLDYSEEGSRVFLLAPYAGACIHVPAPPPNQIVLITSETPIRFRSLFDAFYVTGEISATAASLELAEVGYQMTAVAVEAIPHEEAWGAAEPSFGFGGFWD